MTAMEVQIAELSGRFYDAASGAASWEEISQRTAAVIEGESVMWSVRHGAGRAHELISSGGMSLGQLELYAAHLAPQDLWAVNTFSRRLFDRALMNEDIVSVQDWTNSVVYNELRSHGFDVLHLVGAVLPLPADQMVCLGVHRPTAAKSFEREHRGRLERLLPHIRRSFVIRNLLTQAADQTRAARATLNRITVGAIHTDRRGRIIFANAVAEEILAAADGLSAKDGILTAARAGQTEALRRSIADAASGRPSIDSSGGYLAVERPSGAKSYALFVAPLGIGSRPIQTDQAPAVQVWIGDRQKPRMPDAALLRRIFSFTRNESEIAASLAAGASLIEIAKGRSVSHNTVRTQLAHALAKAEASSQIELVQRIWAAVPISHG